MRNLVPRSEHVGTRSSDILIVALPSLFENHVRGVTTWTLRVESAGVKAITAEDMRDHLERRLNGREERERREKRHSSGPAVGLWRHQSVSEGSRDLGGIVYHLG